MQPRGNFHRLSNNIMGCIILTLEVTSLTSTLKIKADSLSAKSGSQKIFLIIHLPEIAVKRLQEQQCKSDLEETVVVSVNSKPLPLQREHLPLRALAVLVTLTALALAWLESNGA